MSTTNSSDATSGFLGQPPNNLDDYYIVRGIFRYYGLYNVNASLGYVPAYATPAVFSHDSKQPAIIAGMVIVIAVIVASTATRLALRAFKPMLHFGWDDWTVLLASVNPPPPLSTYQSMCEEKEEEKVTHAHKMAEH